MPSPTAEHPRDLIDVFAASRRWANAELEELGRRHARGRFEREGLRANLTGAEWTDDEAFTAYGLDEATVAALPVPGPWNGPTTSRAASSKSSVTPTSTEHSQARPHLSGSERASSTRDDTGPGAPTLHNDPSEAPDQHGE